MVNIAGDLINVWILRQGVFGMGVATSVGYIVQLLVVCYYLIRTNSYFRISPKYFSLRLLPEVCRKGSPSLVKRLAGTLRDVVTNHFNILLALTSVRINRRDASGPEQHRKFGKIYMFRCKQGSIMVNLLQVPKSNFIQEDKSHMQYTKEVEDMICVAKGPNHGPAPIPEEGKWVQAKEVKDISGYTHGIGWCAPQQGACKLSLNVKEGVIEEALVETIGCSGMTHSAAMASEILPGKTILEALNTDLVCDAINTAMRELFLQIIYGRTQSAFSDDGLRIGAGMEDLGKGLRSMVGTMYGTKAKGTRYLEMTEGYVVKMAIDKDDQVCGYQFLSLGKMMDAIKGGMSPNEAYEKNLGTYGRFKAEDGAVKWIDPRKE